MFLIWVSLPIYFRLQESWLQGVCFQEEHTTSLPRVPKCEARRKTPVQRCSAPLFH